MSKNIKNKSNGNTKQVSTKLVNIPRNINRNDKNNMRFIKINKK